jgi:membrane associated rhomboid family serine protease
MAPQSKPTSELPATLTGRGLRAMTRAPWPVWLIFVLCLIPEILLLGADLGLWGTDRWRNLALAYGAFWAGLLRDWPANYPLQQVTMFATYGFLHAGIMHFAVNMITLFSLGTVIALRLGPRQFLALYFLSVVGGALGFAVIGTVAAPMVGASGALFGLAGAWLGREYIERADRGDRVRPVLQSILMLILLNAALWWAMGGHLAWQTHLGGFLVGWLYAFYVDRKHNTATGAVR